MTNGDFYCNFTHNPFYPAELLILSVKSANRLMKWMSILNRSGTKWLRSLRSAEECCIRLPISGSANCRAGKNPEDFDKVFLNDDGVSLDIEDHKNSKDTLSKLGW